MMHQRVVKFGDVTPLAGVLTEPVGGTERSRPWVVLLNSGILHHVGVNRLHVQIARKLATMGYGSLRFDFSGMGDSEVRRGELSFEQSAPRETREAIDYLARTQGVRRVVLMGLCSGADVAHLSALDDERVVGLGLLDPWAYRTRGYWLHYYASRLVNPAQYRKWVSVRWNRLRARLARATAVDERDPEMYEIPQYLREFPPRERIAGELRRFLERGVALMFIFSGGLEQYNHRGQYAASFPDVEFGDRLVERHVPDATHVFSDVQHQELVVRELSGWVATRIDVAASTTGDSGQRTA